MVMALANPAEAVPARELLGRARFVGSGQVQGRVGRRGSEGWGRARPGSGVVANPLLEGDQPHALPGTVGRGGDSRWPRSVAVLPDGSGGGGMSSVVPLVPVGWDSGQPPISLAGQLPAPLMNRPMMRPAQQGQVGQIGRATMQPVPQMMGLAPGQRPGAAGEHTAPVANGQGGPLGGLDDPAGPADLQRLGGRTPQDRGQQRHRRPQPGRQAPGAVGAVGAAVWSGPVGVVVVVGGVAGDQHPGQRAITGQPPDASGSSGPAQPTSPPRGPWRPTRLSRSTVTVSWGRTPPAWGAGPPPRRGGPTRPGRQRCAGCRCGCRWRRLGGPTAPGPPAGSDRPRAPTTHPRRPSRPRSEPATAPAGHDAARSRSTPSGSATSCRCPRTRRSRGGSSRQAASTSTGSASAVTCPGRAWVPWANTAAWATESSPPANALGGRRPVDHGTGPGPSAPSWPRRQRPGAAGSAATRRSTRPAGPGRPRRRPGRPRRPAAGASDLPAGLPAAAGSGPAPPTPHRSARRGPGRPTRPRPRPGPPARPAARPAAGSTVVECVFESMAATYQPARERNHHRRIWGQLRRVGRRVGASPTRQVKGEPGARQAHGTRAHPRATEPGHVNGRLGTTNGPGLLGSGPFVWWCGYCWGCCWSSNVW